MWRWLYRSCFPSYYRMFHRRSLTSCVLYLILLLAVHGLIRTVTFIYWNDLHNAAPQVFSFEACLEQFVEAYPPDLTIQVRNGMFYFSDAGTGSAAVYKLPKCFVESVGLGVSYLSKSTLGREEIWRAFAPIVLFVGKDELLNKPLSSVLKNNVKLSMSGTSDVLPVLEKLRAGKGWDYEAAFLSIGKERTYFLGMIPFGIPTRALLASVCEKADDNGRMVKCSKQIIREGVEKMKSRLKGREIALMYVLSSFSFMVGFLVSLMDCLDLCVNAMLLSLLVHLGWFQRLIRLDQAQRALIREVPTSFYLGLSIHTATPILFLNALLPYPSADMFGIAPLVHLQFTLFILQRYVFPSMAADAQMRRAGNDNSGATNDEGLGNDMRNGNTNSERLRIRRGWTSYVCYQQCVHSTALSPAVPVKEKLYLLVNLMKTQASQLHVKIVHVWSCLNNYKGLGPSEDAKGGPGFCYGLSMRSGTWILIAWYDSPLSARGVDVISKFPGQVFVSPDDPCPSHYFLPSKEELAKMEEKLFGLKTKLAAL